MDSQATELEEQLGIILDLIETGSEIPPTHIQKLRKLGQRAPSTDLCAGMEKILEAYQVAFKKLSETPV